MNTPRWCTRLFCGGGAALLSLGLVGAEPPQPNVLLLNSYHLGYSWSDGEMHGLLAVLAPERRKLLLNVEYLDMKRFPQPEREELLWRSLEQKYGKTPFDLIITLDDPALQFALKYRSKLGAQPPIVFGGVNSFTPAVLNGQTGITGVSETIDLAGTLELILRLQPETREVAMLKDPDPNVKGIFLRIEEARPLFEPRLKLRLVEGWTAEGLLKLVGELRPPTVALILGVNFDSEGRILSDDPGFARRLKEACPVPLYLLSQSAQGLLYEEDWENLTWDGLGGSMISSDVHGATAGRLALRVLQGENADQIPILMRSPTQLAVDYREMERFHLPVAALPAGTRVFHRPVSFYRMHRKPLLVGGAVVAVLSAAIGALVINILRRRRAELALRQSGERFQLIAHATKDAVWDWNPATGAMWWNESYSEMMGVPPGTVPDFAAWAANIHPDDRAAVVAQLQAARASPAPTWVAEYRYRRRDGSEGFIFDRACFLRDAAGQAVRAIGAMTDLTAWKLAERKVQRLAIAVEQAAELIVVLDCEGRLSYANPAFEQLTGFTAAEKLGQPLDLLFDPESGAPEFGAIAAHIQQSGVWSGRVRCHRKDGSLLTEQMAISPIRDKGATVSYVLVARDVTRELKLEEQVRFSQKMEAIGLLAGGVAHDFNNLLQVVLGNVQLVQDCEPTAADLRESLEQIRGAAERAAQLTRQLLVFGRRQPLLMEDIELNQLVSHLLNMVRRLIGEHIVVDFVPGHHLGNVRANPGQLEQVLMNLCVNARDAMPQGGRLTIELENIRFDARFCEAHPWARPGRFVLLSVADTGCGMDSATLARVFDPFFSTKPKDKGSGLGLSVVYGIVQQHEGLIHVYSEPGRGTTFKIYLPIVERSATAVSEKPTDQPARGSGTILLVEDEAAVRQLATKILERAGYRVLAAADGQEALAVYERRASEIRLLVLDVVMPNMGGRETYEQIVARCPGGLPVLFCSGYSADVLQPGFALDPGMQLIQKPYAPDDLCRCVHELLNPAARAEG